MSVCQIERRAQTMRYWIARREHQQKPWTSDQLWIRIRENWPRTTETEREQIFQLAYKKGNSIGSDIEDSQ